MQVQKNIQLVDNVLHFLLFFFLIFFYVVIRLLGKSHFTFGHSSSVVFSFRFGSPQSDSESFFITFSTLFWASQYSFSARVLLHHCFNQIVLTPISVPRPLLSYFSYYIYSTRILKPNFYLCILSRSPFFPLYSSLADPNVFVGFFFLKFKNVFLSNFLSGYVRFLKSRLYSLKL